MLKKGGYMHHRERCKPFVDTCKKYITLTKYLTKKNWALQCLIVQYSLCYSDSAASPAGTDYSSVKWSWTRAWQGQVTNTNNIEYSQIQSFNESADTFFWATITFVSSNLTYSPERKSKDTITDRIMLRVWATISMSVIWLPLWSMHSTCFGG